MPEESGELTAENLLAAAQEFDAAVAAGEQPDVDIKTEEPEPEKEETPPEEPTETAEAEPDSEQQNVDEPESSLTEGETPEEEDKSQKSKWAKNESRKSRSWKEINSQKEAIKKEREELEAIKGELQEKQSDIDEGKAHRDKDGFTAADYERAADRAEEDGDYSDAEAARARAKELAGEGKKAEQDREVKKFQDAFEKTRQELMEEVPSLKETDSELTKESNQILKEHPDLLYASEGTGLHYAVKIAQWKIAASNTDKSQAEVKELTDKLNKLEKKMSVGGGFTSEKLDGDKTFDDLSLDDQESYLLKAAAAHDDAL